MSTIEPSAPYTTLINVFTVDPEHARELADLLSSASEQVIQHAPGFRSANIHLSSDLTRVLNYAQWDSPEAYQAMLQDPTAQEHMGKAADLAISFDPHTYTVESVHEAS